MSEICRTSRISYKNKVKKRVKIEKLLQFAWSSRISYKNHSESVKIVKVVSICFVSHDFPTKTIQKTDKNEKVPSIFSFLRLVGFPENTVPKSFKFQKVA